MFTIGDWEFWLQFNSHYQNQHKNTLNPNCTLTTKFKHFPWWWKKKTSEQKNVLPDRASPCFPFVHVTATVYGIPISRRHRNFDNFSVRRPKKHTNSKRLCEFFKNSKVKIQTSLEAAKSKWLVFWGVRRDVTRAFSYVWRGAGSGQPL